MEKNDTNNSKSALFQSSVNKSFSHPFLKEHEAGLNFGWRGSTKIRRWFPEKEMLKYVMDAETAHRIGYRRVLDIRGAENFRQLTSNLSVEKFATSEIKAN